VLVSFNASVARDLAGKVSGVFAVARDVTQQRQLESKLQEAQDSRATPVIERAAAGD
jgi:signal transduction histidine kinase